MLLIFLVLNLSNLKIVLNVWINHLALEDNGFKSDFNIHKQSSGSESYEFICVFFEMFILYKPFYILVPMLDKVESLLPIKFNWTNEYLGCSGYLSNSKENERAKIDKYYDQGKKTSMRFLFDCCLVKIRTCRDIFSEVFWIIHVQKLAKCSKENIICSKHFK